VRADRGGAAGHHSSGAVVSALGAVPGAGHPGPRRSSPVRAIAATAGRPAAAGANQ
jgi:hypothetical protein